MPYTRAWTKNNPPGSQASNTADDEVRNLREDIEERIAELVTGWTTVGPTDPVVPKANFLTSQATDGTHSGNTTETVLPGYTFSLVGNTISADGRGFRVRAYVEVTPSASGSSIVRLKFAGSTIATITVSITNALTWRIFFDVTILRTGALTSEVAVSFSTTLREDNISTLLILDDNRLLPVTGNPAVTWANPNTLELTGQNGAAASGSISARNWVVEKI